MNITKLNKKQQWDQYLAKWGLGGYSIGFYQNSTDILIWKAYQYTDASLEKFTIKITSLPTLIKRTRRCDDGRLSRYKLYLGGDNSLDFNTFAEVKEYLLIEKLGITNYAGC